MVMYEYQRKKDHEKWIRSENSLSGQLHSHVDKNIISENIFIPVVDFIFFGLWQKEILISLMPLKRLCGGVPRTFGTIINFPESAS